MATHKKKTGSSEQSTNNKDLRLPVDGIIMTVSFVLPFLLWLLASITNPTGWASDNPTIVFQVIFLMGAIYWPVTAVIIVLLLIALFVLSAYKKVTWRIISIPMLIISILYSLFLYDITVKANEDEFTA